MNSKYFWKFKKILSGLSFRIKRLFFRFENKYENEKSNASLGLFFLKYSIFQSFKSLLLAVVIWCADQLILLWLPNKELVISLFLDAVIGGIGVAGVILGLYCANISSVYTNKYSDAPEVISRAFQSDRLTQKCIGSLIKYIIYGIIVIAEILIGVKVYWATAISVLLWSIMVIVSYSLAGNRTYQLSDIYAVADDTYRSIDRMIQTKLVSQKWAVDANFQNHFLKIIEKKFELLYAVQMYGCKAPSNDNSSLYSFMCKNLALISSYWKVKPNIGKDSLWYKNEEKHQKWHITDSTQAAIALKTGTSLIPKNEHNYLWFEKTLFSINMTCLKEMIKQGEYELIYRYMLRLDELTQDAINANEITYFMGEVDEICSILRNEILIIKSNEHEKMIGGIVEAMTLIYLGLFLKTGKYSKSLNIYKTASDVINLIDSATSIETSPELRGREFDDFYKRILIEKKVEGQRITPDWVIKQMVAREEFLFLNSLLRCVIDGMNTVFSMGTQFASEQHLFEGCIILTRFYEFESKYANTKVSVEKTINELESYHLDNEQKWDKSKIQELDEVVAHWKKDVPSLLMKCSTNFALEHLKHVEDYPDFLGDCFNHICADAVDAIVRDDIEQFNCDYDNLTKLQLIYQDYIICDFENRKDTYRKEYAYYLITSPIAEWAQIGGLAMLWGEFHSNSQWQLSIKKHVSQIIRPDNEKSIQLAEKMVEYARNRDLFTFGISNRDTLETGWNIHVANTLRDSGLCQKEYSTFCSHLKTNSILLKAFCSDIADFGFTSDPSEVFWVLCINPLLSDDKKYHSRGSWEDKMPNE